MAGTKKQTSTKKGTPSKKPTGDSLPPSYYRGQDKRTKPRKDKDGYIIPT